MERVGMKKERRKEKNGKDFSKIGDEDRCNRCKVTS